MRTQLTKRIVANAQPQSKPYEMRDILVRGLILRVQPSGHKAWIVSWAHGKRRTLGAIDHLTLEQARAHASQAMAEAVQQRLPSVAKAKVTTCALGDFLTDHYEPWARVELRRGARYAQRIRTHFADLLKRPLHEIDVPTVDRWWRDRLSNDIGKQVVKATAYRDLATLRAALSMAVEWKLLEQNALLGMRQKGVESRKIVRFLSLAEDSQLRKALAARDRNLIEGRARGNEARKAREMPLLPELPRDGFGDHLTPIVLLAMNTGLRRGELLSLRWTDIDLHAKAITVQAENAKSGRQRHIPLNAEALTVVTKWAKQSEGKGRLFDALDVKKGWCALLDKAGIKAFRFHDLRHDFASKLVRAGVDLNTVRELLGHADIKMTLRYSHLSPDGLAAAVAKLGA
ncbi:site-specific integrase [Lysobacter sp. A6]|uniref:Site-specific integrase n=1 Tax=Noviluteimonas lactosilytica TaxID=2888523 RepID=A0ABS8JJ36_9GAMM|nr:tyrosine-type recombinase/integrase [Lysobacter lactosilyticus]MCC8363623.1 site-specific integrase [Lysobacter lactosilyticus]